jgi:Na+-driven multidrug efflux pump
LITVGMLLVTVVLNTVMIPSMGIYGAALAMSLTYGSGFLIMICLYKKLTGEKMKDFLIIKKVDFGYYSEIINKKVNSFSAWRCSNRKN